MDFYDLLVDRYDEVFPLSQIQVDFVEKQLRISNRENRKDPQSCQTGKTRPLRVLDIGCGTGALPAALIQRNERRKNEQNQAADLRIDAVDLNSGMIERALLLHGNLPGLHFREMDMRNLTSFFPEKSTDGAFCLGNTLVHLEGPENIGSFFRSLGHICRKHARIVLQILNYDYILDNKVFQLPVIEIPGGKFVRRYHLEKENLIFTTELMDFRSSRSHQSRVSLFPLRKAALLHLLKETGFDSIQVYGSFSGAPLTAASLPLIVTARHGNMQS